MPKGKPGYCRYPSCENVVYRSRSYCKKHTGGQNKCTVRYCRRANFAGGFTCIYHSRMNEENICIMEKCGNKKIIGQLCRKHHDLCKSDDPILPKHEFGLCQTENCLNKSRRIENRHCTKHLNTPNACVKSFCARTAISHGFCKEHKYLLNHESEMTKIDDNGFENYAFDAMIEKIYTELCDEMKYLEENPDIDLSFVDPNEFDPILQEFDASWMLDM